MNDRGIALAVVLFALVILAELASIGFLTGLEETRAGRNAVRLEHASEAADAGIDQILQEWAASASDRIEIGQTMTLPWARLAEPTGWYLGSIRRLNQELFLIRAQGFSADRQSMHEAAEIVRISGATEATRAARGLRERGWVSLF